MGVCFKSGVIMQELLTKIEELDNESFKNLIVEIRKQQQNRVDKIKLEAQKQIDALGVNLNLSGVAPKGRVRQPRPAKYQNPSDSKQRWSGFGRQPQWYKDYLASGGSEKDMLIG